MNNINGYGEYKKPKKAKKPVSKKNLFFFGGICLCLFSVCLIVNVWYIARLLTFIPAYLFGMGTHLVFLYLYAEGMCLLFKESPLPLKRPTVIIGMLLLFVGILMGLSLCYSEVLGRPINESFLNDYTANYFSFKDYLNYAKLGSKNLSSTPLIYYQPFLVNKSLDESIGRLVAYGGGMIGNLLINLTNKIGEWFSWIIIILDILFATFLIFSKKIIAIIKQRPSNTKEETEEAEDEYDEVTPSPVTRSPIESTPTPVQTNRMQQSYERMPAPAIPGAYSSAHVEPARQSTPAPAYNPAPAQTSTSMQAPVRESVPVQMEKRQSIMSQPNIPNGVGYTNIGVFTPARFIRPGMQSATPAPAPAPMQTPGASVVVQTPEQALLESNERMSKAEQTYLDFDAKQELDESLVQAQPTFEEPKMIDPEPMAQPEPVVAPVMAQPQIAQPQPMQQQPAQPAVKKPIKWVPPSSDMLETVEISEALDRNQAVAEQRKVAIDETFVDFGIGASVSSYTIGPSVTRFNIKYDAHVSNRSVERIVDDISIRLGGVAARFENIVEGQYTSGLEIPNATITTVSFKEVYEQLPDVKKHPLAVAFGKNIQGNVIWADLNEFPHALVAGTTGSGKSVFVNSLITTLIMRNSPDDLRLVLIDPKKVEMTKYRDMPHLLCPVINDANQAKLVMSKLVDEMNDRYETFDRAEGCTSLKEYNEWAEINGQPRMASIVVFIDEYADLVDTCKEIGQPVVSIGQKARAAGIHMIISTQRPSTNVITGTIKSNLPTHIALMTASPVDSCTIVGEGGAEKLLGKGDMLVQSPIVSRVGMVRLQSCFIQRKEMLYVVGYLKNHYETVYDPKFLNLEETSAAAGQAFVAGGGAVEALDAAEEAKYQGIKEWVYTQQYMSMSRIQRECSVGFNRAGRFFTRLQVEGIVSMDVEANRGSRVIKHSDDDTGDDAYCD